jgi:hypothetical protein
MVEDTIVERPELQRSSGGHGLQRKKQKPLFMEELRLRFHARTGSCHQSPETRKKNTTSRQIRLRSSDLLLASRKYLSYSIQILPFAISEQQRRRERLRIGPGDGSRPSTRKRAERARRRKGTHHDTTEWWPQPVDQRTSATKGDFPA